MKILISFYIIFNDVDGYIIECNGYKYLILASTGENKKVLKNTQNFGIRLKIKLRQ